MLHYSPKKTVVISAALVLALVCLFWEYFGRLPAEVAPTGKGRPTIPNIVHYVHLMPEHQDDIHFELKHFISIYSASLYLNPGAIYIHTDATDQAIARAKGTGKAPDRWARLIFNLPHVMVRRATAPEYAGNGRKIENLENKSDFVRAKVVYDYGGIYYDWDVHTIRDVKPLREAGFANVVGLEKYNRVNSGCYMSVKGSELMRLWLENEHIVYDGGWITHAVLLLNTLSRRLAAIPREVLILEQDAFAPSSWEADDAQYLFGSHFEAHSPTSTIATRTVLHTEDAEAVWESRNTLESWENDYPSTYAIHAFRNNDVQNFDGITIKYVLARQSNFARAVYPAVRHAIEAGIISSEDD
jgi:hypothetical protein